MDEKDVWLVNVKGKKCSNVFEISVVRKSNKLGQQCFGWFDLSKLLISTSSGAGLDRLTETVWDKMIVLAHDVASELNAEEFDTVELEG